jgi:hypothetical protein
MIILNQKINLKNGQLYLGKYKIQSSVVGNPSAAYKGSPSVSTSIYRRLSTHHRPSGHSKEGAICH